MDAELAGGAFVLTGALLTGPAVLGYALEALVVGLSDHLPRRPLVVGALVVMSLALAAAALVSGAAPLALALGAWGTAAGIAEGVAETAMVRGRSDPERVMTRWALSGALGDLLAPIGLAVGAGLGWSWRELLLATAALPAIDALAVAFGPPIDAGEDEEEPEPALQALATLARDRVLLGWLLAAASCVFLDELLVMLIALRLDALAAGPFVRGATLAVLAAGLAAGLLASERLAGSPPRTLLAASAVATASLLAWIGAGASVLGLLPAFALGVAVGPMWPLATAAAYARRPDRPGLIAAVDSVVSLPELAAPLLIGAIAERWGLVPALVALLLQPLAISAVAWSARRASPPPAAARAGSAADRSAPTSRSRSPD